MRIVQLSLFCTLLSGMTLLAQNPVPPVPAPPAEDARLMTLLNAWEKKMMSMESLATKCSRTEVEKLTGKKALYNGRALFTRPNFAQLVMVNEKDNTSWEKYVSNGVNLYEYLPKSKIIRAHDLPKQGLGDNTALSFLFGMKVADAQKRYILKLDKEDEWYAYVSITPKLDADKQEFRKAQMVLYLKPAALELMPCRLWFEAPTGDEATWFFDQPAVNIKIPEKEYTFNGAEKGWTLQRASAPQALPSPNMPNPKDVLPTAPPSKVRP